jgi:MoaA/NifB/PqqE/SkfB family radical SAM enzyme
MIKNFAEYYELARTHSPRSHINVSTNGYYTDRTIEFLERADRGRTSITISYDGVRSHDTIRGVNGSQEKLLATATEIRRRFPEVGLSLKLTVTNDNYTEILDTAEQCKELGIPFRFKTLEKLNCHQGAFPPRDGAGVRRRDPRLINEQGRAVLDLGIDTNRNYIEALTRKNSGGHGAVHVLAANRVRRHRRQGLPLPQDGGDRQPSRTTRWTRSGAPSRSAPSSPRWRSCQGSAMGLGLHA